MCSSDLIYDFYDKLKSVTQGYGSFDYELLDYRTSDLVKVDILVNGEQVDALSQLVHRSKTQEQGLAACERLKEEIPRQMFKIAIQAAIGGTIIARETISALRKDVTAKCYGGDISRKRKLLEKQKAGKKRMKTVGNVDIPQRTFLAMLRWKKFLPHSINPAFISLVVIPYQVRSYQTDNSLLKKSSDKA